MIAASNVESANFDPQQHGDMQTLHEFGANCSLVPQVTINGGNLDHAPIVNYTFIGNPAQFKPFACHVCDKRFCSKNSRDKHYRNLHLMERKECGVCLKVFSNIYNLKRHARGAHGASSDRKAGNVNGQESHSPNIPEEKSPGGHSNRVEFREWDGEQPPGFHQTRESSSLCDSNPPSPPLNAQGPPFQSYFEAFIPPRYHHVQDGSFDQYISDDDNLNFLEDGDDVDAILNDLKDITPSPKAAVKDYRSTKPLHAPQHCVPDLGTRTGYFSCLNLVPSKSTTSADSTNNNSDTFASKEMFTRNSRWWRAEVKAARKKEARRRAERMEIYHKVAAFKSSAEGKAERAKIRRKGQVEKERMRRLWGKASRRSNRVARKKGRESPEDLPPSTQSTNGGKVSAVSSNQFVSQERPPALPKRSVRVTRLRSKTK